MNKNFFFLDKFLIVPYCLENIDPLICKILIEAVPKVILVIYNLAGTSFMSK